MLDLPDDSIQGSWRIENDDNDDDKKDDRQALAGSISTYNNLVTGNPSLDLPDDSIRGSWRIDNDNNDDNKNDDNKNDDMQALAGSTSTYNSIVTGNPLMDLPDN